MSESISEFYKGLDMDTDLSKIGPGHMRDASNVRIINNEGQGLAVVNINGNEFRFSLKRNYSPLGYCVYNSIAYIFSTDGINGEIGCYPAPDGNGNFPVDINGNPAYRALQNWTGSNNPIPPNPVIRSDFNTTLLNFDKQHQVQATARIDYDNSVNLYFTDNKNQLRCINSGFDQTGKYISISRLYWTGNFNQTNVFANSDSPPVIDSITLNSGGSLQCGNYFMFLRYSTSSLNKTAFISQSNAIQVSLDSSSDMSIDGSPGGTISNKEVILNISNIDIAYSFIEVAVVYYNQGTSSVYLIDEEYPITGNSMDITITGNEDQVVFTFPQLQQSGSIYNICKTLTQLEDRLWIANLKKGNSLTPAMISFASNIKIGFDTSLKIPDAPFQQSFNFGQSGQYKNYQDTYNDVGYFRGEAYPFGIVFVFTDGTESVAMPCTGKDDFNLTGVNINKDGIYRFPNNQHEPFATSVNPAQNVGSSILNIMGVTFDWTGLTVPNGIAGWYFVRGERKQNLIYQGMVVPTAKAIPASSTSSPMPIFPIPGGTFPNPAQVIFPLNFTHNQILFAPGSFYIPVLDCYIPFTWSQDPALGPSGYYNRIFTYPEYTTLFTIGGANQQGLIPMGFYSPDHFFEGSFNDASYTVHTLGTIHTTPMNLGNTLPNATGLQGNSGLNAVDMMFETIQIVFNKAVISNKIQCDNIPGFTPGGNLNNFTSAFTSDNTSNNATDPNSFFYYFDENLAHDNETLSNKSLQASRYIGMLCPPNIMPYNIAQGQNIALFDQFYSLANIYRDDPDPNKYNILTVYNPKNVIYEKISTFIPSNSVPTNTTCYNGDCFLQRTYLKQWYNPDNVDSDGIKDTLGGGVFNAFGVIFSVITENNTNTAMRIQDLQNFYYPKTGLNLGMGDTSYHQFASNNNDPESDILNTGYNQTLSGFTYQGFDINLPFQETRFPTRIAYSEFHPNGSFTDFYRIFDIAAFQDYDYRLGEINDIISFHSRLVSIQDSGVNFHLVNERALQNSSSAGDILIGSGTVLDSKAQPISDVYGSQHQWSIVQTDYNIYGWDNNKKKIWRVKPNGEFENISDTKNISSWINNVVLPLSNPDSTIVNTLPDNPISSGGIAGGYDRKYGDVIFTVIEFLNSGGGGDTGDIVRYSDSMCFSEKMDEFTNRPQYNTPFYLSLNNDLFTINPFQDTSLPNTTPQENFYVHDVAVTITGNSNLQTFYSSLQESFITYVVNEGSDYEKIYSNLKISSNGNEFSNIVFATEEQLSDNLTFMQPSAPWIHPRFRENFWWVSVRRATSVTTTHFNHNKVGSVMRGKYLKVQILYNQNTQQYIKSVKNYYRISY